MNEREKSKPILCRNLTPELSSAIDAFVTGGIYLSRDQALAVLADIGLRAKLASEPSLREMISLGEQLQELGKIARSELNIH